MSMLGRSKCASFSITKLKKDNAAPIIYLINNVVIVLILINPDSIYLKNFLKSSVLKFHLSLMIICIKNSFFQFIFEIE